MTVFTESQAKEQLEAVLEEATARGEVAIRRTDGQEFVIKPVPALSLKEQLMRSERKRDLSALVGPPLEDPAFHEAIADQDKIDPDMWK